MSDEASGRPATRRFSHCARLFPTPRLPPWIPAPAGFFVPSPDLRPATADPAARAEIVSSSVPLPAAQLSLSVVIPARNAASTLQRCLDAVQYELGGRPTELIVVDDGSADDTARLAQLRLGFYWSPLKVFEYMASGLPVVTIPRPPLTEIARDGMEGLVFREADATALAEALVRLADDPALRSRLGASGRARVVAWPPAPAIDRAGGHSRAAAGAGMTSGPGVATAAGSASGPLLADGGARRSSIP